MGSLIFQASGFPALQIDCNEQHITALHWQRTRKRQRLHAATTQEQRLLQRARSDLERYFAGHAVTFRWPLDLQQGTPFQQRVWRELQKVPYGKTRSYQEIARRIRRTQAARAVGNANGKNPFSIVIPCHRIIKHDGSIGGYAGGLGIKRKLLALERQSDS